MYADEDKELEAMLTDYRDIVGFLRVHKLASINTQVSLLKGMTGKNDLYTWQSVLHDLSIYLFIFTKLTTRVWGL